ncbi:MAG: cell division protein FtsZ [Pseudomonadota bacterium]
MAINLKMPDITELKPRITVFGVGGAGGNAVNNMITTGLQGCDFVVSNTDAQALAQSKSDRIIQMGVAVTEGLGAGSQPEVGCAAAEEVLDEIKDHLSGSHMVFITAGMGGGTGTGAAPVIARAAREQGILTVGVVTKPFQFEGQRRMRVADDGITALQQCVDTLIVIPNQNLFRIANEKTTFADAFAMADQVLYSGVACITDLMVKEGLINLDFADVRSIMSSMGKAMMGTGEASGDGRAIQAAEAAIANPLLDETSMKGARGLLISITGGNDLTLFEVDEAASRIREEVDVDANIILGATFDESLEGIIRVSVVATGIEANMRGVESEQEQRLADLADRLRHVAETQSNAAAAAAADRLMPRTAPRKPAAAATDAAPAATQKRPQTARPAAAEAPRPQEAVVASSDPDVTIEPFQPADAHAPGAADTAPKAPEPAEIPVTEPYIPPAAEDTDARNRPLSISDFPPIARQELDEADHSQAESEERGPMGLLRTIARGLGRKDEEPTGRATPEPVPAPPVTAPAARTEHIAHPQAAPMQPAPQQAPAPAPVQQAASPQPAAPPAPQPATPQQAPAVTQRAPAAEHPVGDRPAQERAQNDGSLYRPRSGDLDPQGRPVPRAQPVSEDDQLEIPAFLRRQSR